MGSILRKVFRIIFLVLSIVLSLLALLIPLTEHVEPDGSYFGIDCDAFALEPLLWVISFIGLGISFWLFRREMGTKAALRKPWFIITAIILLLSLTFKLVEVRKFETQTHSFEACSKQ